MALNEEQAQELRDTYKLLSADELRGMKGDNDDEDAIIDEILGAGKAVEMKTPAPAPADDDADDLPPANKAKAEPDDEDEDDDEPLDPPAAAKVEAPAAEPAAEPEAQAAAEPAADAAQIAPLDLSFMDGEFREKVKALDAEKSAKFKAMMDGEISAEEYSDYEAKYLDRRDGLKDERAAAADWFREIHGFKVKALGESGINYDTDAEKAQAWDEWVKRLVQNPAHARLSGPELLALAHKKVMVEFDVSPAAPAAKPAPAPEKGTKPAPSAKKVAEKQGRAPDLSGIPPTIGALPSAAGVDGGDGGEFGHLDNLTGMEYERALARLSPEQKARYETL